MESISSPDSWNAFLDPILSPAARILGVTGYDSTYDAEKERTEVTLAWGAEEHRFHFAQESDYANLDGLLAGLNRFARESGFRFHLLGTPDPMVGFLTAKEAAFLKKNGLEV